MRSNFIKELESCRVTFQGPFCKHPIGILTVCVCKLPRVCVHEGMNGPRSPLGDCWWFSGIIFQNTNAACFKLAESVPSRGQRSGDCHTHPFQLRTEKPDRPTVNVNPDWTSSFRGKMRTADFLFFSHSWLRYSGAAFHLRAKLWAD